MSVRAPLSTSVTPVRWAKPRATSSRLACTSATVMPASRAISPGCGVSTSVRPLASLASRTGLAARIFSASASITAGHAGGREQAGGELGGLRRSAPGRDRWPAPSCPPSAPAICSGARFSAEMQPAGLAASGKVISSGATAATSGSTDDGNRRRDQARSGAQRGQRGHSRSAGLAYRPSHNQHVAEVALVGRRPGGASARAPATSRPSRTSSAETMASGGEPMGATTTGWSQRRVSWPKTWAGLGAVKVMTASAGKTAQSAVGAVRSAGQPEGRSTARTGARLALIHSSAAAARPLSGGLKPVPTMASRIRSASSAAACRARSSALFDDVDECHGGAGQLAPCRGGVAREAIGRAQQQRGHLQAGGGQQPRGHQAVAAVVAAPAEHRHAPRLRKLLPRKGGHGGCGRAHQLQRRHAEALAWSRGRRSASRRRKELAWEPW